MFEIIAYALGVVSLSFVIVSPMVTLSIVVLLKWLDYVSQGDRLGHLIRVKMSKSKYLSWVWEDNTRKGVMRKGTYLFNVVSAIISAGVWRVHLDPLSTHVHVLTTIHNFGTFAAEYLVLPVTIILIVCGLNTFIKKMYTQGKKWYGILSKLDK